MRAKAEFMTAPTPPQDHIDLAFLPWNRPILHQVCEWLLPSIDAGTMDLSDTLVIVPTKQTGRRLREALALRCAQADAALLPPRVQEPLFFRSTTTSARRTAGPLLSRSVWTTMLRTLSLGDYAHLFPVAPPQQDLNWATRTVEPIQQLRNTLGEAGWLIQDIVANFSEVLEEPDRWRDLAKLEQAYLRFLESAAIQDRSARLIEQARQPTLPDMIQRIVVAGVPDPSPLMTQALTALAGTLPITLLIHAPPSEAHRFDAWGRPIPEQWVDAPIHIRDPAQNLHLGASPAHQAELTLNLIAAETESIGPSDLAIGVPDSEVAPYVDEILARHGLISFNPSGSPLSQHRVLQALDCVRQWWTAPTYQTFSQVLRHPDLLRKVAREHEAAPLLAELDRLQNRYVPVTWTDVQRLCAQEPDSIIQHVLPLFARLDEWRSTDQSAAAHIADLLQWIYADEWIDPQEPDGDVFRQVAQAIQHALDELAEPLFARLELTLPDTLSLILHQLSHGAFYTERQQAQVDLDGWLELPWNDARMLIVTGMNDGFVPDSRLGDLFLPDSLLQRLGLRSDRDRLARDAYLMTTMVESRSETGRACFITGAVSRAGDPLRPSRLLFQCPDDELVDRAIQLFADIPPRAQYAHAAPSFQLDTAQTGPLRIPDTLGITAFRSFLQCPYRFYLSYVLRMQTINDDKQEWDALDFGSLIHEALNELRTLPTSTPFDDVQARIMDRAHAWVMERHGHTPTLPIQIQFRAAQERLRAALHQHGLLCDEGWEPRHFELALEMPLNGMRIKGRIDRVDFHPATQRWRIIDYKTRDQVDTPSAAHWNTRREDTATYAHVPTEISESKSAKQWSDLQLPLYALLFQHHFQQPVDEVAYLLLPRAVSDTQLSVWEHFNPALLESAQACAAGVIADIQAGRFWPPAESIPYDAFETMFPFATSQCVRPFPPSTATGERHAAVD